MGSVKLTNRILAFFIDLIFLIIVINIFQNMIDFNALEFQFGQIGRFDISLNFAPPIVWFYTFFACDMLIGSSLGKIILSLGISDLNGEKADSKQLLVRNITKSFISPIFLIGFIMPFFNSKGLALHDKLSQTKVISHKEKALS